jgi:hypothetical protein
MAHFLLTITMDRYICITEKRRQCTPHLLMRGKIRIYYKVLL